MSRDRLPTHRVGIVVFATVDAVDQADAAGIATVAIRNALKASRTDVDTALIVMAQFTNEDVPVTVHRVAEVGVAARQGYLWTAPTGEAYPSAEPCIGPEQAGTPAAPSGDRLDSAGVAADPEYQAHMRNHNGTNEGCSYCLSVDAPAASSGPEPRVFPPDSPEPGPDVQSVRCTQNDVVFKRSGLMWTATKESYGDGYDYSWRSMNSTSSPEGGMTFVEVLAGPEPRVWREGDDEPIDKPSVRDRKGEVWRYQQENCLWFIPGKTVFGFTWSWLCHERPPLTEVLDTTSEGGRP